MSTERIDVLALESSLRDEAKRGHGAAKGSIRIGDHLVTCKVSQGSGRRGPNCFTATYFLDGKRISYAALARVGGAA